MSKTNRAERKRRPKLYVPPAKERQDNRTEIEQELEEWEEYRLVDMRMSRKAKP